MNQLMEAPYGTLHPHEWALLFDRAFEKISTLRTGVKMIDGAYDQVKSMTEKLKEENEKLREAAATYEEWCNGREEEIERMEEEMQRLRNTISLGETAADEIARLRAELADWTTGRKRHEER